MIKNQLYIYAILTIVILGAFYFLGRRIGLIKPLIKSKVDREKEKEEVDQIKMLTKEFEKYTTFKDSKLFDPKIIDRTDFPDRGITETAAKKLAEEINDSFGFFNDDEDTIFFIFKNLKNKSDISSISKQYELKYKSSLKQDLLNSLSEEEIRTLQTIINEL